MNYFMHESKDSVHQVLSPVMLIAFNRPKALINQLKRLDNETPRIVEIFIDGEKPEFKDRRLEVINVASAWAERSRHQVNLNTSLFNFGIREHFPRAAEIFFSKHKVGIILEDDITFSANFFQYCDYFLKSKIRHDFWSICGHNPASPPSKRSSKSNSTFLSNIHTIHGWATNHHSIERYLSFRKKSPSEVLKLIEMISRQLTIDPMLRKSIELTWKKKFLRSLSARGGGSWDNSWVLAGWFYGAPSILPSFSLTQEIFSPNEGGTHESRRALKSINIESSLKTNYKFSNVNKRRDIKLMKIWGITRQYSWGYFYRIHKQISELQPSE